jgi:glycosyltransferase involved in cell wall biosynthesis/SAM-dependent methyltransferase
MRIAIYVHCFFPTHFYGTEAYTLALAKVLAASGHEVVVVSATLPGEPIQSRLIEDYTHEGVRVLSIDKNFFPDRTVRDTYEQPALRHVHERILRKLKPDVVHVCHMISHTTALMEVTRRLRVPTFATLTDFFGFCYNNRLENAEGELCRGPDPLRANCIECFVKLEGARDAPELPTRLANLPVVRPLVSQCLARLGTRATDPFTINGFAPNDIVLRPAIIKRAMNVYHEAIAPSLFLKQAYERNGFPAPMRISHFGVEIDRDPKPPRPARGPIRLGFIGQILPHKGLHILLDALQRCGHDNLSLSVWGSEDQNPAYARRVRDQAASLPVTFNGVVPRAELGQALRSIDYLVIPSTWYENSPLILLQALASHTPAIVSDVLGMTEFVHHGRNGFHFERGDARSLAAVLQRVANAPDLIDRLGAATEYDRVPTDMARDVLDMYSQYGLPRSTRRPPPAQAPAGETLSGIEGDLKAWLHFNTSGAFQSADGQAQIAPFAPVELMRDTTGLARNEDFARHGADIVQALSATTNRSLSSFCSWLDFGVGVGRLARMFKGFTGRYVGVDVDPRNIGWVRENLPWVEPVCSVPGLRLPLADSQFDMIVSISVFSHMNEIDQEFYLSELQRVAEPTAHVVITVHGEQALQRAIDDTAVQAIIGLSRSQLLRARMALTHGPGFQFVRQSGHLTTDDYEYGVAFMTRQWIDTVWSKWYDIISVTPGGIHGFQDVVVLRPAITGGVLPGSLTKVVDE